MKKNKSKNGKGTSPAPARDGFADWTKDRQAAHLAAFQEVQRKDAAEIVADLQQVLAADCADRAGDHTCHDAAMPDLMAEAVALRAARMIKAGDYVIETLQNLSAKFEDFAQSCGNDDAARDHAESVAAELRDLARCLEGGRP